MDIVRSYSEIADSDKVFGRALAKLSRSGMSVASGFSIMRELTARVLKTQIVFKKEYSAYLDSEHFALPG